MPVLSERSETAFESPIRKLSDYANKAKEEGVKVYHLNIGQPDIKSPKHALEALKNYNAELIPYGDSEGLKAYRLKLLEYYRRWNIDSIVEDDIIVTTGASEALLLALFAICDEGDEIIVPEPFYANYNGICAMAGVKIKPISTPIEEGFPLPSKEQFLDALTPKTKGFLLCNPNNPTGKVYDLETLRFLEELVKDKDLYLISDEVYREFCYDGQQFHSALSLELIRDNVIVLDSISKRYSACGARVGCMITHNKQLRKNMLKYAQLRLCPPIVEQHFALATIDTGNSYFEEVVGEYDQRRKYLLERLSSIDDVKINYPQGAFYVFAQIPVDDVDDFAKWLLTDFREEGATVMLAPGTGFYATSGLGKNEIRIAYVLNIQDLEKAINCFEKGLESYKTIKQKAVLSR